MPGLKDPLSTGKTPGVFIPGYLSAIITAKIVKSPVRD
jgi:hypothetical protein